MIQSVRAAFWETGGDAASSLVFVDGLELWAARGGNFVGMKINNFGTSTKPFLTDRDGSNRVGKAEDLFAADLLKSQDNQSMDRLTALLAEIDASGKQLSTVPTYAELKKYRELVRSFIGEAVGRMYSLESQSGWDRHGRHKMFKIIRKVDETLVDMAEDVRVGQERQLSIMAKHDAVRGMLVDLYS